jgi:hypothetical protein
MVSGWFFLKKDEKMVLERTETTLIAPENGINTGLIRHF